MTPFQVRTLIHQHNKYEEKREKELEKIKKEAERNLTKKSLKRR